jgi:hypothetical protein
MSALIDKSDQNIAAALELRTNLNLYAPSIHCAYYSCVQLMIDVLINDFGIPDNQIEDKARAENTGSHAFASNKIFQDIKQTGKNFREASNFNNDVQNLRRRRTNADYHEFVVSEDYSARAYEEALRINGVLKEFYKLV